MKNQREIYEALLAGETLTHADGDTCRLNDRDELINASTGHSVQWCLAESDAWQIYKEPKWYENIPDGGVLCVAKNGAIIPIKFYEDDLLYKNQGDTYTLDFVTPMPEQEIQIYLNNAPEDL